MVSKCIVRVLVRNSLFSENLAEVWSDGGLVFKVEGKIEELQDGGDE